MILRKRRNDRILGVSQDTPLGPRRNGATLGEAERGRAGVDGVADVTHELGKKILTLGGIADPHEGSKGLQSGGGALPLWSRKQRASKWKRPAPRCLIMSAYLVNLALVTDSRRASTEAMAAALATACLLGL